MAYWIILDETCTNNNNNNNIHVSIPPLVVTSEAVVAQVTSLLFDMNQIKKVSLKSLDLKRVIDGLSSTVLGSEFQTAGDE